MGDGSRDTATTIYDRAALATGSRIQGPAILTQDDTTTLVGVAWIAETLPFGHLLLTRKEPSS